MTPININILNFLVNDLIFSNYFIAFIVLCEQDVIFYYIYIYIYYDPLTIKVVDNNILVYQPILVTRIT